MQVLCGAQVKVSGKVYAQDIKDSSPVFMRPSSHPLSLTVSASLLCEGESTGTPQSETILCCSPGSGGLSENVRASAMDLARVSAYVLSFYET